MNFKARDDVQMLPVVSVNLEVDHCLLSEEPIDSAKEAIEFVADKIYDSSKENAVAIFCDDSLAPLCVATVGSGDPSNVMFSARDIVQTALLCNASYVTLMHNHPGLNSGVKKCGPSKEDILMTDAIVKACTIVGVKVYDSIIASAYKKTTFGVPQPVYYSIREHGLNKLKKKFGIEKDKIPQSEFDLKFEPGEEFLTNKGQIANQQKASKNIEYRFVNRKTRRETKEIKREMEL